MTDIKRQRKNPYYGMSGGEGITDPVTRRVVMELQQRITELSAQVNAPAAPTAAADTSLYDWSHREVARLDALLKSLTEAQSSTASKATVLARALEQLHAYVISNTLGETIPSYSVTRITAYDPDTDVYTVGKPLGGTLDKAELLLFTGHFDIEDVSLGIGYPALDRTVKATYTTVNAAFVPTAGTVYETVAATYTLVPSYEAEGAVAMGLGSTTTDYDTEGGTVYVRGIRRPTGSVSIATGAVQVFDPTYPIYTASTLRFTGRLRGLVLYDCLYLSAVP